MSDEHHTHSSGGRTICVILLIILTAGAWYMVIYGDIGNLFASETNSVVDSYTGYIPANENLTTLGISISAEIADVDIIYWSESSNDNESILADWNYRYAISEQYDQDPVVITINEEEINETLYYHIDIEYDEQINPLSIRDFELDLYVSPNFDYYYLHSYIEVGALELDAENLYFEDLILETTTGYQEVYLRNITLASDVLITTTTGGLDIDFTNLKLVQDISMDISTTTGGGDIHWIQDIALGADINFEASSSTGGFEIYTDFPLASTRVLVSWDTDVGGVDYGFDEDEYQLVDDNHIQSLNYEDINLDTVSIYLETSVGGIDLEL